MIQWLYRLLVPDSALSGWQSFQQEDCWLKWLINKKNSEQVCDFDGSTFRFYVDGELVTSWQDGEIAS